MRIIVAVVVTVIMILPFVLVGSGVWLLAQRQLGEQVEVEVIGCDLDPGYRTASQHCVARWTEDGVEMTAPIQGSGDHEVGETVTATKRGDDLYSRSLTLPLIFLGLGLPMLFFPLAWLKRRLTRSSSPA